MAQGLKRVTAERDVHALVGGAHLRQPAPRMLDYACGNGAFALAMGTLFPRSAVWATDFHVEAPHAPGNRY